MDRRTLIFILCVGAAFFGLNYYFTSNQPPAPPAQHKVATAPVVKEVLPVKEESVKKSKKEEFYVLQNDYQQLVFSNVGASLAEINLPFKTEQNDKSSVRPIEFDREMQQKYPYNDRFPATAYNLPGDVHHDEGILGGFYPLIRRDLFLSEDGKPIHPASKTYALNIVSDYPELAELVYDVKEFDAKHIVFEATQEHRKITKSFTFAQDPKNPDQIVPYMIQMTIKIDGDNRGLWVTSGVPEVELLSGSFAPSLKYRIVRQNKSEVETIDMPKEREAISVSSLYPTWVSNTNSYLGIIMNPISEVGPGYKVQYVSGNLSPTRLGAIDPQYKPYKLAEFPGYNALLPLKSGSSTTEMRVFAGPLEDAVLKQADAAFTDAATGANPQFISSQNFQGWFSFISEPFAKFLFVLMTFFYSMTASWAASIVLLTIALRVMLYPLNAWSFKSMRRMQELAPEVSAIQARYKKEPKKAQMEVMNLYRTKKVNPFTGCLPILIQMPFLIGMFDLLKSTFALRGAPFIPGWIDNLTAPDVLFSWNYPIPFVGTQFHLLPFLLGAAMFLQQKMSSTLPKDINLLTDQQRQQRFMGNIMVIFFTVMFYNFPSGLNLYWLSSMLLGILQQWITNKKLDKLKLQSNIVVIPKK